MIGIAAALAITSGLTDYPAFTNPGSRIEAQIDRGPIVELVVSCGGGRSAIVSYSKVDRLFCTPRFNCRNALLPTLAETCAAR